MAAVRLTEYVCVCVCTFLCVVCVSGNGIGAAGGTAVAEALKVNTSVLEIDLCCECCWWCLPCVHACGSSEAYQVHVWCVSANDIGAAGVTAVAEALKVNSSVQEIHLRGE